MACGPLRVGQKMRLATQDLCSLQIRALEWFRAHMVYLLSSPSIRVYYGY